ncbi:MAG: type II toxin-antitoxin system RelE/ParE family toxin [Spirochaetaceae bacterium]|jgi:hypothetical protein|nr:type II toxin-antitoxin system RelE/ParE family toxin [Spirochaetaceae bacterium]
MEFVETSFFTRLVTELLEDESLRQLQNMLITYPECGRLIRRGGGIRKLRWALPEKGKSGGLRIIYYYQSAKDIIYLLYLYPKSKADTMTASQISQLAKLVKEIV